MRRPSLILILMAVLSLMLPREAQAGDNFAIKTNLLSDVGLNPNLGIEFGVAPRWSIDLSGQLNGWTVSGKRWRHWAVQPEVRYWFCQRFQGHFLAINGMGGQFNVGNINDNLKFLFFGFDDLSTKRYQGWMAGAGIAYGYSWILNKHWNIEAEIGAGWIHTVSDVYPCKDCGTKIEENLKKNHIGLTKAAVNLVYLF